MPTPDKNDDTESIGIPVTKAVVQVPGAMVIPMPIITPPNIARGSCFFPGRTEDKFLIAYSTYKCPNYNTYIYKKSKQEDIVGA